MTSEAPLLNHPGVSLANQENESPSHIAHVDSDDLTALQRERDLAQKALITMLILNARQNAEMERLRKVNTQYRADLMTVQWESLPPASKTLVMLATVGFFRNRVARLFDIIHSPEPAKKE